MKICYLDESGTGDEPVAVVAGVVVDSHRMHVTKADWAELLNHLSEIVGRPLDEIHTKDFYRGNGSYRAMSRAQRAEYIEAIFEWLADRKHHVVFSAIEKESFRTSHQRGTAPPELTTPWRAAAFHVTLAVQRAHQKVDKTKGHTLLIFDNKVEEQEPYTQLVLNAPDWSDEYYQRQKNQDKLSHITDAPYFADSKSVGLIQVADFIAYFLRRHAEIAEGLIPERYADEAERVKGWVGILSGRSIGRSHTYPSRGRCLAAEFFYEHCPPWLRGI
jgi:hypothetical protein